MTPDKIAEQLRQDASAYSQGFADGYRLAKKALITCGECMYKPTQHEEDGETIIDFPVPFKCPCECEDPWYDWVPEDDWFCGNAKRREEE